MSLMNQKITQSNNQKKHKISNFAGPSSVSPQFPHHLSFMQTQTRYIRKAMANQLIAQNQRSTKHCLNEFQAAKKH